jgi:hypothetical protein
MIETNSELLPNELERDALAGLNAAVDASRVLLWEEAFRDAQIQVQIEAERNREDGEISA